MSRYRLFAVAVLLVAVVALAGCSSSSSGEDAAGTTPAGESKVVDLAGTSWSCYEFSVSDSPQTVPEDTPITADFGEDKTLSGKSGVNTYNTTYETDGDSITIGKQIITTKMAGPEAAMQMETDYLTTLPTAVRYNVDGKGDLILFGPADNMIARYRPAQ